MNNDRTVKGILGSKLGMTQLWDTDNKVVPVTVIQAGPCVVTQVRTPEKDGYNAVQLAFGAIKPKSVNAPETGHFEAAGVTPRRHLVELRTADASEYTLGQEVGADTFAAGDIVDVTGVTTVLAWRNCAARAGIFPRACWRRRPAPSSWPGGTSIWIRPGSCRRCCSTKWA